MAIKRIVVPELDGSERLDEAIEAPDTGDLEVLLDDTRDWKWHIWRHKTADELARNPRGQPSTYVTTLHGKVDLTDFHQRFGGGDYEFRGHLAGLRGVQERVRTELEGAHRPPVFEPPPAAAAPAPSNGPAPAATELGVVLQNQQQQLAELRALVAKLTDRAPSQDGMSVKEALTLFLPLIQGRDPGPEAVKEMIALYRDGVKDGAKQEPGEPNLAVTLVEKLTPAVERIATAMVTRRVAPRTGPAPRAVPEAVVVGAAPESPEPPDDVAKARWQAVVDSLARAIPEAVEPGEFAATLEHVLTAEDIEILKLTTTEALMLELGAYGGGRYPVLATPEASRYVNAVLSELRNPPLEDE